MEIGLRGGNKLLRGGIMDESLIIRKVKMGRYKIWGIYRCSKFVTAFRTKQEACLWVYLRERR